MKLPSRHSADAAAERDALIAQFNEVVYLTDQAARNHVAEDAAAAPRIRELPPRLSTRDASGGGWLKRLRRRPPVDESYQPTTVIKPEKEIVREPLVSAKPSAPVTSAGDETPGPGFFASLLSAKTARLKKIDRGDVTLAGLGVALGLICALFPWYIFFNPEKFGPKGMVFDGAREERMMAPAGGASRVAGSAIDRDQVPRMNLDFFPTATLTPQEDPIEPVPAAEQPFPSDLIDFKLVYVANGRALIQDDDGLWVVQPGSRLPDSSRVTSIEKRDGAWALITTFDKIVRQER